MRVLLPDRHRRPAASETGMTHTSNYLLCENREIHYTEWGADNSETVIAWHGLARTGRDMDDIAAHLASRYRVICPDTIGRGLSQWSRDPRTEYSLAFYARLAVSLVEQLGLERFHWLGTSMGGALGIALAAGALKGRIRRLVLNDIGPVIEPQGLMRIKTYVGKLPQPRNFEEGAEILRRLFSAQFPKLGHDDWLASAHRAFKEEKGRLVTTYDVKLAKAMEGVEPERPIASLWKEFDALSALPVMVIRGANSDILSADTVEAMRARRVALDTLEVPDQGHAPLLAEAVTIARIAEFVSRCDRAVH